MRVDHRCFDVAMPQQLLNRAYVVPALKQVSGEGMAERMARRLGVKSCNHTFILTAYPRHLLTLIASASPDRSAPLLAIPDH